MQHYYEQSHSIAKTIKKFSISRTVFDRAVNIGIFYKHNYKHKHTAETKHKLSVLRKKWLNENKDKHPWKRNTKFISIPCEYFKKILKENNYSFVEEFTDSSFSHNYSLDIAFIDAKLCIEINGNQHYNRDGTLNTYYKKRENYLKSLGWTILQIRANDVYNAQYVNAIIQYIDQFLHSKKQKQFRYFCLNCKACKKRFFTKDKNTIYCTKCIQRLDEANRKKKYNNFLNKKRIDLVITSSIDFSRRGWPSKLAALLKLSPQYSVRWMKKNMKEFYNNNCYKL